MKGTGEALTKLCLMSSSREMRWVLSELLQLLVHIVRFSVCSEIRVSRYSAGDKPPEQLFRTDVRAGIQFQVEIISDRVTS